MSEKETVKEWNGKESWSRVKKGDNFREGHDRIWGKKKKKTKDKQNEN